MSRITGILLMLLSANAFSQDLKKGNVLSHAEVGFITGTATNGFSNNNKIVVGAELNLLFKTSGNLFLGTTSGVNLYISPKSRNSNNSGILVNIPLGASARYYTKKQNFYVGVDGGYSFFVIFPLVAIQPYTRAYLGFHHLEWNYFAWDNLAFFKTGENINTVGIGAVYNFSFK